ncbi:MAG: cupin domain-containing protein [Anaerolineae bacterium]|nr:cupin domain-containing protein [Anaerolineae bacterium]MCB0200684.1 cupin domain-containing protein [Anaerolineae bacterium]MCB0205094.1 cupin domain-containing protein [Anaerolineae bacterium]MCB0255538.1 cupin domain-containing protein [Anaerolineae bacterium]
MSTPRPFTEFALENVHDEGAVDASIRWVITEKDGSENYALRVIELAAHGNTPHHTHWFEHQNYVIEGEGTVTIGNEMFAVKAGDVIFVPGDVPHQYRNTGDVPMKFLCGIPQPWIKDAKAAQSED